MEVPDHWMPEVEECIRSHCLTDSARSEIIRVLVTQLFAHSRKPSRVDCEQQARKLILKYPFMKDDMGIGYVSYFFIHSIHLIICIINSAIVGR